MRCSHATIGVVRRVTGGVVSVGLVSLLGCVAGPTPKGTLWTIRCLQIHGPDRLEHIEQVAESLKHTPGIRPSEVHVTDDPDGFTCLYYGTYRRHADWKTGKRPMPARMRKDIDLIRQLGNASGKRYFLHVLPVRMPTPDVGNPQWDLTRVRAKYSLQVAVFEPTDDFAEFKQAAAEYCAWLRERGYEAYYHHGPASSVVTVGAFGPEAVITKSDGHRFQTIYGSEVLALQRDELLKYNLLNGSVYRARNDQGISVPMPSRLVEIPSLGEDDPW